MISFANFSSPGSKWQQFAQVVIAAPVPFVEFLGLGGFTDILITTINLTKAVADITSLIVSVDNGVSYFNGANDYLSTTTLGVTGFTNAPVFHSTASALARSGTCYLIGTNLVGNSKNIMRLFGGTTWLFNTSLLAINAIRVTPGSIGVTLDAGSIEVLVR